MNAIACILAATLAVQAAPPPARCEIDDNACKGPDFEQRAARTQDPTQRAARLYAAHRSYLALFDETHKLEHLCAARRTFEQSIAIKEQSERQRTGFVAKQSDLEAREREHGGRCREKARRPRREAPLVARVTPPARADETTAPDTSAAESAAPPPSSAGPGSEPANLEATPVRVAAPLALEPLARTEPETDPLLPVRRPPPPTQKSGRPLVIVGSITLLGGLALMGAAGFVGARLLDIRHQGQALADAVDGYGTAEEVAQDTALRSAYRRTGAQTAALAVTGGAVLIIGAVLTGVGARRMARALSRTALLPAPGGLALRVRF